MLKLLKNSMVWPLIYQKIQSLAIFYSISQESEWLSKLWQLHTMMLHAKEGDGPPLTDFYTDHILYGRTTIRSVSH